MFQLYLRVDATYTTYGVYTRQNSIRYRSPTARHGTLGLLTIIVIIIIGLLAIGIINWSFYARIYKSRILPRQRQNILETLR